MSKKLIITLGDPFSINVELVAKNFAELPAHTLIIGSRFHWQDQLSALGVELPNIQYIHTSEQWQDRGVHFLDCGGTAKRASALSAQERGAIAVQTLESLNQDKFLAKLAVRNQVAVLTMPIDKHACHSAGFKYLGHTEFFSELSACATLMLLAGPRLRVGLASNHLALSQVSAQLSPERILQKLELLHYALQKYLGIKNPKIAVCGLNPHCGDGGLFGDEESRIIEPALRSFRKNVHGPFPADTIFFQALQGKFDAVLAMYHDQGLGPLKTVHFDEAVNVTCGLPYLRLSPDHGPAKDLFLANKASARSFEQALHWVSQFHKDDQDE